jgi:hypothetical protein
MTPRDAEGWLLDAGDEVIRKGAEGAVLSDLDKAIYCMWVLDYAVRNSGTLEPMRELHPVAKDDLLSFARARRLDALAAWLGGAADEESFCAEYYTNFERGCTELRKLHELG